MAEHINGMTDEVTDLRDALKGKWGREIGTDYKLIYLQNVVIGIGDQTILNKKLSAPIYGWDQIGDNIYLGVLK